MQQRIVRQRQHTVRQRRLIVRRRRHDERTRGGGGATTGAMQQPTGKHVSHIGNLLANIQLVDPLAIMHAVNKSGGAKPLGSKTEMSNNMTVFLAYAPVGRNTKAFQ